MDNSFALFLSVLFICVSILIAKTEIWELQDEIELLKKQCEVINND